MKLWKALISMVLLLISVGFSYGQKKCQWINTFDREILLDSLSVIPSSIVFKSDEDVTYRYDPDHGLIFIKDPKIDSVEVCYQTLPFQLFKTYYHRDEALIGEEQAIAENKDSVSSQRILYEREELLPTENLQKSGSISRGISFGNNQDVVVNSALNLQMEGDITDDLKVRASITDQQVPYQPEGNTAQIQDFDNVFVELYNDNFTLKAGDVLFKDKPSHFLKYYKNVQGGLAEVNYTTGKHGKASTSFGASVAKGKFATIELDVREGVSGPYRLEVPGASKFLIILANSEKVYLDGQLLKRGYDYDYVIDYDKAEITFTSKVLITRHSRVKIDIEYADQNYGRSIIKGSHYQEWDRFGMFVNFYQEKDNRSNPLTFDLSNDDKIRLSQIGDELDKAFKDGYTKEDYNAQKVQYHLIDTVTSDNEPVQVFKFVTQPTEEVYNVAFTDVGSGNGDYIQKNSLANGKVFEWVSPESGVQQGRYAPIKPITPPNARQMTNIGGHFNLTEKEKLFTELAFSTNDQNLYSDLDSEDDNGMGLLVGFNSAQRSWIKDFDYKFSTNLQYEFTDQFFQPIDRFRAIEFDRDWNYIPQETNDKTEDHIVTALLKAEKDQQHFVGYQFTKRNRGQYIDGLQNKVEVAQKAGPIVFKGDYFNLKNEFSDKSSSWNRINTDVSLSTPVIIPGYQFLMDKNKIQRGDSVTASANFFDEHIFYIKSNDTLNTRFRVDYHIRNDQMPFQGEIKMADHSQTVNVSLANDAWKNHQLELITTYRKLENDLGEAKGKIEETVQSRVDWYATFFKNHVRSNLNLAIGSGRELKREFSFVEVPLGEGTHTWRDDNDNGLQELNEFYLAVLPDEKQYIKILTPTDEYVPAFTNNFNYRLNIQMPRNWNDAGGIRSFLSKISNISSFTSDKKFTNSNLFVRFFPFTDELKQTDILSSKLSANTRFFFNRNNPGFGMDIGATSLSNKQLLSGGFDERNNDEISSNLRYNIKNSYSVKLKLSSGNIENRSNFLTGRNYTIKENTLAPQLSWQSGPTFRLTGEYAFRKKENVDAESEEFSNINEGNINIRYSKVNNLVLSALVRYVNIEFEGKENSPAGYELLEALRPGENLTWNFSLQKKLIAGLQVSINYEGRKSEGNDVIHIGRMQVSALF